MEDPIVKAKKPAVAVDVVLFTVRNDHLEVGLIARKPEFHGGTIGLPGSFVTYDERIEETAKRAIEKGGVTTPVYIEQLYTFGQDLDRDKRVRTISIVYFALIDYHNLPNNNTLMWHRVDRLPRLCFDHNKIVEFAVDRLGMDLLSNDQIFNLLPEEFTLTELQSTAEAILGHHLDKRNFRKKVTEVYELKNTRRTKMAGAHRPAALFSYVKMKTSL